MEQFMIYLEEQAARLREEGRQLAADDRRDEGDLSKIRANVYGICKSVLQVQGSEKAKTILTGLHGTWSKNLEIAREHDDVKQAVIEEIKIETLSEILRKLEEV